MSVFWSVVRKELLSFIRSWPLVLLVLYIFSVEVYVAGSGIEINPRNVAVGYVDNSGGGLSQKYLSYFHGPEFVEPLFFPSQESLSQAIYDKEIMVGIIFDETFEKAFRKDKHTTLNVLLDATAASQSFTALSYMQNITLNFTNPAFPVELVTHKLFNENADNKIFMALSELLSNITLLSIVLTAMVFVKEKEDGTWDIMLLMPVNPKIIILAKSFSQVLIVMMGVVISVGFIIFGAFNTPINGSFFAFLLLSFLYSFTGAGIGLFVAAMAKDVMQVAQLSIVIMLPLIFLSGAWTPIYAMHPWLQTLSYFSPLRYYIEGSESIFFRGTPWVDLYPYFLGVFLVGSLVYTMGFRKIGRLF